MVGKEKNAAHEEVEVERMEEPAQRPYYSPLVDIYEQNDALVLVIDMPGVGADGVEVTCENGVLTINGRINVPSAAGANLLYEEYVPGDYHRCFRLSGDVDVENIAAKMSGGVLRLTLPKTERVRRRHIEVK